MSKTKTRSPLRLPTVPAAIRDLLGPPPLLSTEHEKFYYAMLAHFAATVKGNDFITWLLLKDVADARVEIARYRRFKALRIAICHEGNKKQALAEFKREKKIEHKRYDTAFAKQQLAKQALSAEEKERHNARLDNALATVIAEVEAEYAELVKKLRAPDTDHDFALVFRRWVEDLERLDVILQVAEGRFRAALDELDWYQAGRFTSLADELDVIEGEVLPPVSRPGLPSRRQAPRDRRRILDRTSRARALAQPTPSLGSERSLKKAAGEGGGQ